MSGGGQQQGGGGGIILGDEQAPDNWPIVMTDTHSGKALSLPRADLKTLLDSAPPSPEKDIVEMWFTRLPTS